MWHVEAVELFFFFAAAYVNFSKNNFLLYSQHKSLLQCGQITVVRQIFGDSFLTEPVLCRLGLAFKDKKTRASWGWSVGNTVSINVTASGRARGEKAIRGIVS